MRTRWATYGLALLFWTAIGLFFTTQLYLLSPEGGWAGALQRAMPRWYIWGALVPGIIWLDRRLPDRLDLPRRLLWHLFLGVGWTFVFIGMRMLVQRVMYGGFPSIDLLLFARNFYWDYLIYWLLLGVYIAFDYYREMQARQVKAAQLEASLSEARLQMLQAQLHPHFLFNTLNAISAFMETEPKAARRMTAQLGELLRASLDQADQQEITLADELALLENYLAIERMRFEDQLTIEVAADAGTHGALVPRFVLQPLVENAIRHGITTRASAGTITISAARRDEQLVLRVCDDGVGLPPEWDIAQNAGIGLSNTAARLSQLYDGQHTFTVENVGAGGVCAAIALPFRANEPTPESRG